LLYSVPSGTDTGCRFSAGVKPRGMTSPVADCGLSTIQSSFSPSLLLSSSHVPELDAGVDGYNSPRIMASMLAVRERLRQRWLCDSGTTVAMAWSLGIRDGLEEWWQVVK
jgi:hypothetical protein